MQVLRVRHRSGDVPQLGQALLRHLAQLHPQVRHGGAGQAVEHVLAFTPAFHQVRVAQFAQADLVRGEVRVHTSIIGDPVIIRRNGRPQYNFAVVIDDADMAITHVVRGEDHISNTPLQILIAEAIAVPTPAFAHLSLVLGPDHAPLSKRHGATSVAEFRARGFLPEALVNYLALVGWSPAQQRVRSLVRRQGQRGWLRRRPTTRAWHLGRTRRRRACRIAHRTSDGSQSASKPAVRRGRDGRASTARGSTHAPRDQHAG